MDVTRSVSQPTSALPLPARSTGQSTPQSPVRDVYGRMRRLNEAIDDADSSVGQRVLWTKEYVGLSGELVGMVGARTAAGAELLARGTRIAEPSDGHTPRVESQSGTDVYL